MKIFAFIMLILFPFASTAGENDFSVVAAAGAHDTHGELVSVAYTAELPEVFGLNVLIVEPTIGYFSRSSEIGEQITYFGAVGVGIRYKHKTGLYIKGTAGPALLSEEDEKLGSMFQFLLGASVGIQTDNVYGGIVYRHFSNAGLTDRNSGRDFIGLETGLQF